MADAAEPRLRRRCGEAHALPVKPGRHRQGPDIVPGGFRPALALRGEARYGRASHTALVYLAECPGQVSERKSISVPLSGRPAGAAARERVIRKVSQGNDMVRDRGNKLRMAL